MGISWGHQPSFAIFQYPFLNQIVDIPEKVQCINLIIKTIVLILEHRVSQFLFDRIDPVKKLGV